MQNVPLPTPPHAVILTLDLCIGVCRCDARTASPRYWHCSSLAGAVGHATCPFPHPLLPSCPLHRAAALTGSEYFAQFGITEFGPRPPGPGPFNITVKFEFLKGAGFTFSQLPQVLVMPHIANAGDVLLLTLANIAPTGFTASVRAVAMSPWTWPLRLAWMAWLPKLDDRTLLANNVTRVSWVAPDDVKFFKFVATESGMDIDIRLVDQAGQTGFVELQVSTIDDHPQVLPTPVHPGSLTVWQLSLG